jgi:hypothetical protein
MQDFLRPVGPAGSLLIRLAICAALNVVKLQTTIRELTVPSTPAAITVLPGTIVVRRP